MRSSCLSAAFCIPLASHVLFRGLSGASFTAPVLAASILDRSYFTKPVWEPTAKTFSAGSQ